MKKVTLENTYSFGSTHASAMQVAHDLAVNLQHKSFVRVVNFDELDESPVRGTVFFVCNEALIDNRDLIRS
jgi:hypothetical protein